MIMTLHRIQSFMYKRHIPFFPRFIKSLIFVFFKCVLPPSVVVGRNVKFWHHGLGIIIHPNVVIGDNCNIYNFVVIGGGHDCTDCNPVQITIENDVTICAGSLILCKNSPLIIASGSTVAANSVVFSDVPANVVVGGSPCKILKYKKLK